MPALSIRAKFPLGVYVGHQTDGTPDPFPDVARLHAALLHAAGTGVTAIESGTTLAPSEDSLCALRWLEENPPTGIYLPERCAQSTDTSRFIYRKEGTINVKKSMNQRKVSDGVSLNGPIGYRWDDVPDPIITTLQDLCADVAVLGETESRVILDHDEVVPNLVLDTSSSMFTPGGYRVRAAGCGRTHALIDAYSTVNPGKNRAQKAAASEVPFSPPVCTQGLRYIRYIQPEPPTPEVPWDQVLLLELGGNPVSADERMAWCLTFHRAIISAIGEDVPSVITGVYSPNVPNRPANQLSIQYFTALQVGPHGVSGQAIGLLIPREAAAEDLARLASGLSKVKKLRNRYGERTIRFNGVAVNGDEFWAPPEEGYRRLWSVTPVAVTETRSPKPSKTGGRRWGLADAGVLSVAHVWRGEFQVNGNSDERLIQMHSGATDRGVRVGATKLHPVDTNRYVHKSHRGTVPQCWSGLVYLGNLAPDTAIVAIGQSRHLGGGLLEPVDIPESLYPTIMGGKHA